ncbi:conserved exported hypothetical protein [Rubrivivax sp. A210]|uniref:DUF2796 domain-containing protein n=1 Tax=Rubrivivax sp. A210 TaxID=2772301 RepID=UPI00191AB0E4|nr:DUF2796 domain-containing protein [Rubrivivax sp. A210]CAD5374336.1 conserved exported hypothetical protein [Rubrivivax sp. A210]
MPLPRYLAALLFVATGLLGAGAAVAAGAHEHGVARLDIAVDAARVSILLETPLENLLGFEHAPRTDAEREKVAAALTRLRASQVLFRIDSAAGCQPSRVDLQSAALGLGTATNSREGHGDLDATFDFKCSQGGRAGFVEVGLFETFPGLQRIELQVATPKGQMRATLRRPTSRVMLAR